MAEIGPFLAVLTGGSPVSNRFGPRTSFMLLEHQADPNDT
jgi:hypothetical protein